MLKKLTPFLFLAFLFTQCSDESGSACEGSLESIEFTPTHIYTGDIYHITGEFCANQIKRVWLNNTELDPYIDNKRITFTVPPLDDDSVSIVLETTGGTISLDNEVGVYPGSGTWSEKSSFIAEGRGFAHSVSSDGIGYIIGGSRFDGYSEGFPVDTYFKDVYAYNEATNSWSAISLNKDPWHIPMATAAANGKIFSIRNIVNPADIYTIATGAFTTSGPLETRWDVHLFTSGTTVYLAMVLSATEETFRLEIRKYNAETNAWDYVQSTPLEGSRNNSQVPFIDYAFVRNGIAYIGTNNLNMSGGKIREFDLETSAFTKGPDSEMALKLLFVIDGLAYFREHGESSLDPTGAEIIYPSSKLYMYNLLAHEWRVSGHAFPESVYSAVGFSLNNRGFSGMSTREGGQFFAYSLKLYEFLPE